MAATDGPEAITVQRIAGNIYQLFDNIAVLRSLVLCEILERLNAVALTGKVDADVLALVEAYLAYERDEPVLWRTLFDLALPGSSELPNSLSHQISGGLTRVERALEPLALSHEQRATAARTL